MSRYVYDNKAFSRTVTFAGIFCIFIGIYSVLMLLSGNLFYWIVLLVCIYQVCNTFVSPSNPSEVIITPQGISFSAYGKTRSYPLDEVTTLRIREINPRKKIYLRIATQSTKEGRYWVNCENMSDGKELWERLAYLEYCKEPNQIKFRAYIPTNPDETDNNNGQKAQ